MAKEADCGDERFHVRECGDGRLQTQVAVKIAICKATVPERGHALMTGNLAKRFPADVLRCNLGCSVKRGSRDVGWTPCRRGLVAKLRDPALGFLFVVRVGGCLQIVAQFGDYLIGLTSCEVNLREHQACVRKCILTLAKHFNGFRSETALGQQGAPEHIA